MKRASKLMDKRFAILMTVTLKLCSSTLNRIIIILSRKMKLGYLGFCLS